MRRLMRATKKALFVLSVGAVLTGGCGGKDVLLTEGDSPTGALTPDMEITQSLLEEPTLTPEQVSGLTVAPSMTPAVELSPIVTPSLILTEVPSSTPVPSATPSPIVAPKPTVTSAPVVTDAPMESFLEEVKAGETVDSADAAVPQKGVWQLKVTTDKKYIILGTDDDNIGNAKFFRLLRTYGFPYTMNTEAENVSKQKELGPDTDDTIFTSEDAPALFLDGVDVITLGKYIHDNDLGEVAQHGSSRSTLWDSEKLSGDFLAAVHTDYVKQGGTKTEEELRMAIMEQLSDTDGLQGASYVDASRAILEDAYGFPIYTVGIWGGVPVAIIDGIECNLNRIKGVQNYDWRVNNYISAGTVLGTWKANNSTYDLSRVTCDVDAVAGYIEKIGPGKVCEFFWHMPFQDEPDITKWRTLFGYIKSLVDSGKAEVVTRRQYAEMGEWVDNPITKITITRDHIPLGEADSDDAYTITAFYADNSTENVTDEAIINNSAINTGVSGIYTVSATYRGFEATAQVSVIDTDYMIPEGLKDYDYWFVAKNETQNILIAGNTTSSFGRVGASASAPAFFDCESGLFNGWISRDNGSTWVQVNVNNQHYRNVKTNTTEGTSCFNFGSVAGDCITWLETSGNFSINY